MKEPIITGQGWYVMRNGRPAWVEGVRESPQAPGWFAWGCTCNTDMQWFTTPGGDGTARSTWDTPGDIIAKHPQHAAPFGPTPQAAECARLRQDRAALECVLSIRLNEARRWLLDAAEEVAVLATYAPPALRSKLEQIEALGGGFKPKAEAMADLLRQLQPGWDFVNDSGLVPGPFTGKLTALAESLHAPPTPPTPPDTGPGARDQRGHGGLPDAPHAGRGDGAGERRGGSAGGGAGCAGGGEGHAAEDRAGAGAEAEGADGLTGWRPINEAPTDSLDPLLVWSKETGRALAEWKRYTGGWEEFSTKARAYRDLHPTHWYAGLCDPLPMPPAPVAPVGGGESGA